MRSPVVQSAACSSAPRKERPYRFAHAGIHLLAARSWTKQSTLDCYLVVASLRPTLTSRRASYRSCRYQAACVPAQYTQMEPPEGGFVAAHAGTQESVSQVRGQAIHHPGIFGVLGVDQHAQPLPGNGPSQVLHTLHGLHEHLEDDVILARRWMLQRRGLGTLLRKSPGRQGKGLLRHGCTLPKGCMRTFCR